MFPLLPLFSQQDNRDAERKGEFPMLPRMSVAALLSRHTFSQGRSCHLLSAQLHDRASGAAGVTSPKAESSNRWAFLLPLEG